MTPPQDLPPPADAGGDAKRGLPPTFVLEEPPGTDPEARYRTLMERMPDAILIFGHDFEIYYANPAALRMFGAEHEDQLVGRPASDFAHPAYERGTERNVELWDDLSGGDHSSELIALRLDGTEFEVRVTLIPTMWGGRPAMQSLSRDVTAENRARTDRARYQERIRGILESSLEGVVGLDTDGTCTFVNRSAARAVGCPSDEIVGRSWHELFHHSHPDGTPYPAEECPVMMAIRDGHPGEAELDWYWRSDGTAFPVQIWSQPVVEDGVVTGAVLNFRDISERITAHDELAASEQRFRAVFDGASTGMALTGLDGTLLAVNAALERLLGREPGALKGMNVRDLMHPDDVVPISAAYVEVVQGRRDTYEVEKRYLHVDGSLIWARLRVSAIRDDAGRLLFTVTMIEDVTAERLAADAMAHSERRFRSAFHDLGTGMVLANVDGTLLEVNRSACELLGYRNDELVGRNWLDSVHIDDLPMVVTAAYRLLDRELVSSASEHRAIRRDGREVWMISTASLLEEEGSSPVFLMQMQDITERKRAEAELSFDATHDQLTRLPNRVVVLERLTVALSREPEGRASVAVLFVDLDHFKLVNDSYGHDVGDEVLVALAERLGRTAGPDALVARFAGDEFIVLCESCPGATYAIELADRLAAAIAEPLVVEAGEVQLTASIGIAFGHSDDLDPDLVLRDADLAMFEAKARGRARSTVFDDALRGRARYRLETARALRLAIEREELVLHYQPVVEMRSGTMTGVEALVRWEHPDRGLISPAEFMPVAEETGLVVSLGAWVLDESCRQGAAWAADPEVGPVVVSVNLSARQFNDDALVPRVTRALQASGLPPQLLCLEITESAVMDDVTHTGEVLAQLRGLGVALSIDDFGTGYSSLSYLKQFPVDALKIDRSFVDGLGSESEDTQIVTAVVHLAHALGLTVVAEGVETAPQLEVLRNLGCERVQGYLIARPQPGPDLIAWLHGRRAAAAGMAGAAPVRPTSPSPSARSLAGRRHS